MFVIELIYKAEDPFRAHGLADFRVFEFRASQSAKDMPKRVSATPDRAR